jgi:hypothetical protein
MSGSPHRRQAILAREVAAWQDHRNKRHAKADWHHNRQRPRQTEKINSEL